MDGWNAATDEVKKIAEGRGDIIRRTESQYEP